MRSSTAAYAVCVCALSPASGNTPATLLPTEGVRSVRIHRGRRTAARVTWPRLSSSSLASLLLLLTSAVGTVLVRQSSLSAAAAQVAADDEADQKCKRQQWRVLRVAQRRVGRTGLHCLGTFTWTGVDMWKRLDYVQHYNGLVYVSSTMESVCVFCCVGCCSRDLHSPFSTCTRIVASAVLDGEHAYRPESARSASRISRYETVGSPLAVSIVMRGDS